MGGETLVEFDENSVDPTLKFCTELKVIKKQTCGLSFVVWGRPKFRTICVLQKRVHMVSVSGWVEKKACFHGLLKVELGVI